MKILLHLFPWFLLLMIWYICEHKPFSHTPFYTCTAFVLNDEKPETPFFKTPKLLHTRCFFSICSIKELLILLNNIHPLSPAFHQHLAQKLKTTSVTKEEYLLEGGRISRHIYFIKKASCVVITLKTNRKSAPSS